jgi:RimJ/RimL family protein N-acetyltransferase
VASEVTLRPYTAQDRAALARCDSEFDDFGPAGWDLRELPRHDPDRPGGLVICEDDAVVGSVSWIYRQWGPTSGSECVMIGIALMAPARGRGIGTRAQRQLVELVFAHTRIHRVEAHTDVTNLAEQHALEKAGFTREGVVRASQWRRGRFHDGVLYSILRTDPGAPVTAAE